MTIPVLAFLLLQVKHFFGDFVLQSARHLEGKGRYGAWAGIEHAGVHAGLTFLCLGAVGLPPTLAVGIAALEWGVHYHLDWAKEQWAAKTRWTAQDRGYWVVFGADQLMHQLTYVGIVGLWL
jgi:hypothetical protein